MNMKQLLVVLCAAGANTLPIKNDSLNISDNRSTVLENPVSNFSTSHFSDYESDSQQNYTHDEKSRMTPGEIAGMALGITGGVVCMICFLSGGCKCCSPSRERTRSLF